MSTSTHESVSPAILLSNPMILSPSPPSLSETEKTETNTDMMEIVHSDNEDVSPEKVCEDISMTNISVRGLNEDTLSKVSVLTSDLDKGLPMEEEPSILNENISTLNATRENTNDGSSTPSVLSWENVPSPMPGEMARLNLGN